MIDSCPVCGGDRPVEVLYHPGAPVHQNTLMATQSEALACPRGDIALTQCAACGFVFNAAFDERLTAYVPGYDPTQTHSPTFSRYLTELADDLIRRHGLRGKTIVEIGCGRGDFLRRLCRDGANTGIGFDPSYPGGEPDLPNLTIVPDLFGAAGGDLKAQLICARHVIEHVSRPAAFLDAIRAAAGHRSDVLVFVETPRLEWILEQRAFWDVFYEHCSYFAMPVLRHLFERVGFAVTAAEPAFGGQYQWLEARLRRARRPATGLPSASVVSLMGDVRAFAAGEVRHRAEWRQRIAAMARNGGCAVWGAGAKGVAFLNAIEMHPDAVPAVVDLNPRKQGRYVPGTGQPVIPPARLADYDVRTVLVMNPNYVDEIRTMLGTLGLRADVISL